jgi:hypothetical protein
VLTWTLDGEQREVDLGAALFTRRGVVHHFINLHKETTRTLAGLTGTGNDCVNGQDGNNLPLRVDGNAVLIQTWGRPRVG